MASLVEQKVSDNESEIDDKVNDNVTNKFRLINTFPIS